MSGLAVLLVLSAAVAHAAWNVIAHGLSRAGLPFLWCAAVAGTAVWAVAIPLTGGTGTSDLRGFLLGIAVSAVLHVAYMLVLQRGYAVGSLSTVYSTARGTGPLLSVVLAIALLGERPSALALLGVAIVIAGVVAVGLVDRRRDAGPARRGLDAGLVFGLLTGVAIAAYTIWDAHSLREWGMSPVAYMVGCTLLEIPLYSLALGRRHREILPLLKTQWSRLLAVGVLSPLSYILVLTAMTVAPVALVAPMREVSVVLVSLFGALVLRESRPAWRVAASVVVLGGVVLLAM